MRRQIVALAALASSSISAFAGPPSFAGRTVTMVIGFDPGGGTDAAGRLIANYLTKYLPGHPGVVVQNMPGADGIAAMNYIAWQAKPDGLTITMGANTQVDPLNYRRAGAQFDPSKFPVIGGVGRGGTVLLIDKDAEKRLHDPVAKPALMGSVSAIPRSGMQMTLWGIGYLGWNAKWVVGYPGTNEAMLALSRGEIDMTSTANMFQIAQYTKSGKFDILNQSGSLDHGKTVPRPDFGNAPLFVEQMKGKIEDPLAQKAFAYWVSINSMDKWLGLPPGAPDDVVKVYRAAFDQVAADADFRKLGGKISEDFTPMSYEDVQALMTTLSQTPTAATSFIRTLMKNQGIPLE
jgi:tripartite-type tricarboxylate transporter receptor subunit TctC